MASRAPFARATGGIAVRSRIRIASAIAFLVAAFASTAHATPVTVIFNGYNGFGISEVDALDAAANFGIPILTPDYVGPATDILDIFSQDLDGSSIQPFPPTGDGPHTATSEWRMQNVADFDLNGSVLMLFVTVDPFEIGGSLFDYPDGNVGLTLDAADGWFLVKTSFLEGDEQIDLYYPALLLALESLEAGEVTDPFDVHYFIDQEIMQLANTFVLPQFRIGLGYSATPIPEPGTFALFGIGLAALAVRRQRRP